MNNSMHPRDQAITMSIGGSEDGSAVKYMQTISGQMYAIKGSSIWRIQLADEIDPDRSNNTIPNTQQRVASSGANSEAVRRTLIQAIELVRNRSWKGELCADDLLSAAMKAAQAASIIDRNIVELEEHAVGTKERLSKLTTTKNFAIPSYPNLEVLWASSLYAINSLRTAVRSLVQSVFPKNSMRSNWLQDLKGKLDFEPTKLIDNERAFQSIEHDMKVVREFRNIEQHPKPGKYVNVSDYWMRPDGLINTPTVHIAGITEEVILTGISEFLSQMKDCLVFAFEMILLWCIGSSTENIFGQRPFFVQIGDEGQGDFCGYKLAIKLEGKTTIIN